MADVWHRLRVLTQAYYLIVHRTMPVNQKWIWDWWQYRRVCKQGGVVVPRCQHACHPAFPIKPTLIYGPFAHLRLFISSHVCLVSFPLPQSNRFFRGWAGLWAAGEGVGQEEVGDQRIAFPCASPLPTLRLSIQLLLKRHTPTWAGAIHMHLFGCGLTHEQEIQMYVMHLILRALQIKSFLRFWLVCGCSFYTIFSPPAHTLEPTQIWYMHAHTHTHTHTSTCLFTQTAHPKGQCNIMTHTV